MPKAERPGAILAGSDAAQRATALLASALGVAPVPPVHADHPALAWRRAGLMDVTGRADGTGLASPVPLTALADGALALLRTIAAAPALPQNGALLLGERARLMGLGRRGAVSANGTCRLLPALNGSIALNLPRDEDWDSIHALVGEPATDWEMLAAVVRGLPIDPLVAQGRLLGLAVAADKPAPPPATPFRIMQAGPSVPAAGMPLVVDLSGLWAGPLAGALLADAGARVIKVEGHLRPDGARDGHAGFFDLLNGAKQCVAFDFHDPADVALLRRLIGMADIVIEASRPRALRDLHISAEAEAARGATWLSITAHGRDGEAGDAVGFGDDAAVAGGLSYAMRTAWDEPLFAGDAIADPLTGILAALAGWASWRAGGGKLIAMALADVVAFAMRLGVATERETRAWQDLAESDDAPSYPLRQAGRSASKLGSDTGDVLRSLGLIG